MCHVYIEGALDFGGGGVGGEQKGIKKSWIFQFKIFFFTYQHGALFFKVVLVCSWKTFAYSMQN